MSSRTLLERILAGKYSASMQTKQIVQGFIREAVAIDAENVSVWTEETNPDWKNQLEIMPKRLPFPVLWLEHSIEIEHEENVSSSGMVGILAVEIIPIENVPERIMLIGFYHDTFNALTCVAVGGEFTDDFSDFTMYKKFLTEDVFTDPEGFADGHCISMLQVFTASMIFFNCKNVEIRRKEPSRKKEKKLARLGIDAPAFHVIEVHKQRIKNVYERGISKQSSVKHASMVRGHFKTYTEENPLLGKIAGTWFWESHVRGDIGTPVLSDYKVYQPIHKGKCQ